MPAYIGITIGGSLESPTPGLAVVVSTTTTTGKDIELVLNTWPAQPVTKTQLLQALTLLRGLASKNGYFRALLNRKCLILNSQFFQSACSADLPPCGAFSHSGFIRNVPPL